MLEAQGARVVPRRPTRTRAALSSAKQEVGRKKYRWEGASVFSPNANERRQETCLSTAPWCLQRERPGEKPPELTNRTASPGGTARVRWSSGGRLQGLGAQGLGQLCTAHPTVQAASPRAGGGPEEANHPRDHPRTALWIAPQVSHPSCTADLPTPTVAGTRAVTCPCPSCIGA